MPLVAASWQAACLISKDSSTWFTLPISTSWSSLCLFLCMVSFLHFISCTWFDPSSSKSADLMTIQEGHCPYRWPLAPQWMHRVPASTPRIIYATAPQAKLAVGLSVFALNIDYNFRVKSTYLSVSRQCDISQQVLFEIE